MAEIKSILERIESDKSPGPDGLNAHCIKECSESLAYPLHLLFTYSV